MLYETMQQKEDMLRLTIYYKCTLVKYLLNVKHVVKDFYVERG